jgi:hypothetical protein
MPSTHRTQVLLPDHIQTKVQGLATKSKRSMSAMCCELIEYALEHGVDYQSVTTDTKALKVEALINGADLDDERMRKLLKLLDGME